MINENVSTGKKNDGKNSGACACRQEETEQKTSWLKKAMNRWGWVSRFFSTEPKAQQLELQLDPVKIRKMRVEWLLRRNGFTKGVNGAWAEKDWWKPRKKN